MTATAAPVHLSLDHVGTVVRNLAGGADRWQRLGFTLSPQSRQRGAVPGEAGMQPWATANRCALFRRGYLELIGVVDPTAHNPWGRFLDRFEGPHLLAVRCEQADAAYASLSARSAFLDPPVARERRLTYRAEERTMRFRNIFSRDAACPEGRYIVIEHQTPELLWQEELLEHENGACALLDALVVASDPGVGARLAVLGAEATAVSPQAFAARFGATPPVPSFAAVTIGFRDLARTLDLLARRGVPVERNARGERWLAPAHTNGLVIRLAEHG